MKFDLLGQLSRVETIAVGSAIHEIGWLEETFGSGRWRKLKGLAWVRLEDGRICRAEIHWYEAHGIGKKRLKIKRVLR